MEGPPSRPARSHRRPGSTVISQGPPSAASLDQEDTSQTTPRRLNAVIRAFNQAGAEHRQRSNTSTITTRARRQTHTAPSTDPAFAKLESVLRRVASDWATFSPDAAHEEDFNSISLALDLLKDQRKFKKLLAIEEELADALRSHGQSNYLALDASIRAYHALTQSIVSSQSEVSSLRTSLLDVKHVLSRRSKELAHLETLRDECEESERILDSIDSLKTVPDRLESFLSAKRFRPAVSLLVRSLKTINKPEIRDIGALSDLVAYLQSQESSLFDILVDELHSHLYLKTFYCDSRWKSYVSGQTTLPSLSSSSVDPFLDADDDDPSTSSSHVPELSRFLHTFSLRTPGDYGYEDVSQADSRSINTANSNNMAPPLSPTPSPALRTTFSTDPSSARYNPEANSFIYIETLISSLDTLGRLPAALNLAYQRVPLEIHTLVEETIEEAQKRRVEARRNSNMTKNPSAAAATYTTHSSIPIMASPALPGIFNMTKAQTSLEDEETLKDLFWTLYSKLDAVLQAFRVVYEVNTKIAGNPDYRNGDNLKKRVNGSSKEETAAGSSASPLVSLEDVWKCVQGEIRSLLFDYLVDDQERATGTTRKPIMSVNDILKLNRPIRDYSKVSYKLSEADSHSIELKRHEDALNEALKSSVPGLVSGGIDNVAAATGINPNALIGTTISTISTAPASNAAAGAVISTIGIDEHERQQHPGAHRLLVRSHTSNLVIVRPPTMAFLDRVKQIMPHDVVIDFSSLSTYAEGATNGGFLEEFSANA